MMKTIYSLIFFGFTALQGNVISNDKTFLAKDFFQDAVGVKEDNFQNQLGWKAKKGDALGGVLTKVPTKEFQQWQKKWIEEYPKRQTIFEGQCHFKTVGQLNQELKKKENESPLRQAKFAILLHDPKNEEATEITALQAKPENNGAVFQIASTMYGPLEGATADPNVTLTSMLETAAQGEWATAGTAGAVIFRKYFMPRYVHLLENFKNDSRIENIGIFTHENIAVTSWCKKDIRKRENAIMQAVPVECNQKVTHVFNAALDLRRTGLKEGYADFAQIIITGMYEGALKSAQALGKKKVYLTLLGSGVFGNDIGWIANAIDNEAMVDLIKKSGLEVYLIYRPERDYGFSWQPRTFKKDKLFLKRMFKVADEINGTCTATEKIKRLQANGYMKYIQGL